MHRIDGIRTGVGIVGNIISALLFLSPAKTYWRIVKNKSTEEFHPYPYLATTINCMMWIFYGLPIVHPNSTLVVTINGFGLAMEVIYLSIFFTYTTKHYRKRIGQVLLFEALIVAGVVVGDLLGFRTHHLRSLVVGSICDVFGVIMYASPLSVIATVVRTKSAEFMPFWLVLAGFCNGVCWFSYAWIKTFDISLAVANGIGALFGLTQLSIWFYYTIWGRKKSEVENDGKPGQVQLQNFNNV